MIKHRFIVRGADDFKIFAAIPCEKHVLTWKKWVRPPDWDTLREYGARLIEAFESSERLAMSCARGYRDLHEKITLDGVRRDGRETEEMVAAVKAVVEKYRVERAEEADTHELIAASNQLAADRIRLAASDFERTPFDECVVRIGKIVTENTVLPAIEVIRKDITEARDAAKRNAQGTEASKAGGRILLRAYQAIMAAVETMLETHKEILDLAEQINALILSSDPLPDTPCPAGTPFAAYSIEFKDSVFNVVEGCAWVSSRPRDQEGAYDTVAPAGDVQVEKWIERRYDPTDEEKSVVEIITQMLVERGLNPKAETRIPVVEADAKDAHHVREAERRDQQANRAPKVRTIKFNVTPPRYLREAAERIFATPGKPRKAHWVIGHWRNQACGAGHKDHREKWINPHIRGLGEAGAVVARVAAADKEVAGLH